MTIEHLVGEAEIFRAKLEQLKRDLGPQSFEWYRYDSLANIGHIANLLTGANRDLTGVLKDKPVLDIGCADGDLAFFLESLGCEVTVVDYPFTNHNHMAGVHKLKEALGSRIQILSMDVDSQFTLPGKEFGLALVLGAIYHLKNPFYLLEAVSKRARHTVLSTRIARHVPGLAEDVSQVSLAYLLGATELNGDKSNFWIFTEASFRQLLKRTNWDVLDLATYGDKSTSDPVRAEHDERLFCFARSRYAMANVDLLEGWHDDEGDGWRWTAKHFAIRVRVPVGDTRTRLTMKVFLPQPLLDRWGELTLETGGAPPLTLREAGYHETHIDLGPQDGSAREVRFSLDHAVPPDQTDDRERGIIVHSLEVG